MTEPQAELLHTPLHACHTAAGARMVPFAGWDMPVYYQGITREVNAVRQRSGIFDVSHMGRLKVTGRNAEENLQRLTVNDIATLGHNGGQYTLMLLPSGGVLDDLIVYRRSGGGFLLIVNASNRKKILGWMSDHFTGEMHVEDGTIGTALIALQGPEALDVAARMGAGCPPPRFHLASTRLAGAPCEISRTGYTGEDGIEIIVDADKSQSLWDNLVQNGAEPCGLGARDTLRLEAAYCLYGHEITEAISPLEAGLSWVVKWDKGDFIGREALVERLAGQSQRLLAGLEMDERSVPRTDDQVMAGGQVAGFVTSGTFSPTLGKSIAMAYLDRQLAEPGTAVEISGASRTRTGRVRKLPFYRLEKL